MNRSEGSNSGGVKNWKKKADFLKKKRKKVKKGGGKREKLKKSEKKTQKKHSFLNSSIVSKIVVTCFDIELHDIESVNLLSK